MTRSKELSKQIPQTEFFYKLLLLLLLIIDAAFCTYYFFKTKPGMSFFFQSFFSDMVIGVLSGFSVRSLFRNRSWIIKAIVGSSVMVIGLIFLGWLSNWEIGFGPLIFWRNTIDWRGLINIALGLISMLLALQAWNSRQLQTPPVIHHPEPAPVSSQVSEQAEIEPAIKTDELSNKPIGMGVRLPVIESYRKSKPRSLPAKKNIGALKKTKVSSRSIIHLAKNEEHLCPYCLEPVTTRDSRGIVECQICHTLHHGDCWEITGACQVPHYTA